MNRDDQKDDLGALRNLPRAVEPPVELEERVVASLRRRGLLAERRRRPRWLMAAALLVAALGGWLARGLQDAAPAPGPGAQGADAQQFLLLLSEPEGLRTGLPEAALVAEYSAWASDIASRNQLVTGAKLTAEARRLVSPVAGQIAEAAADDLGHVTGYFIVRADGWSEALELARSCPHVNHGGEISVRALERAG